VSFTNFDDLHVYHILNVGNEFGCYDKYGLM